MLKLHEFINYHWYSKKLTWFSVFLWPISCVFRMIATIRKRSQLKALNGKPQVNVPIIVIGNISVGGSGKTPFVIWLANYLTQKNLNVGIVSSGYKSSSCKAMFVDRHSDPRMVGDEAVIFAHKTSCNIVSGGNRVEANKLLTSKNGCV